MEFAQREPRDPQHFKPNLLCDCIRPIVSFHPGSVLTLCQHRPFLADLGSARLGSQLRISNTDLCRRRIY